MPNLLDEILSDATAAGYRPSVFERWIAENGEAEKVFWDVMKKGYGQQGIPFARVLKAWSKHFPEAPTQGHQAIKRLVDAQISS